MVAAFQTKIPLKDGRRLPDEDTAVPEEFAGADKNLGQLHGRLLGEGLHLQRPGHQVGVAPFLHLDVAEVDVGALGYDAEGHENVILLHIGKSLVQRAHEEVLIPDDKVPGRSHNHGLRVTG